MKGQDGASHKADFGWSLHKEVFVDKISRILPASARVVMADVAEAQPARPGAPDLGRPMGKNSLGDRITISQKAIDSQLNGGVPQASAPAIYKNNAESAKVKMIAQLSDNFFNPKIEAKGSDQALSEELAGEVLA